MRALNEIAVNRGQKLAQLALQWALRDPRVTSAVIGASSVEQLDTNLDALEGPPLTDEELAAIDQDAVDSGINLWAGCPRGLTDLSSRWWFRDGSFLASSTTG